MIYNTGKDVIGKRVLAFLPLKDGSLEQRAGFIEKFMSVGAESEPMFLVKYDNIAVPHAAQPEWLIAEPK